MSSSSSLSSSSLLLPTIHKGPRARQSIRDTNPTAVLWKQPSPTSNEGDSASRKSATRSEQEEACGVCRCNQARYTCPKCEIPYCSVKCYRNHNTNSNADQDGAAASSSLSCTETFYHNRVSQVLQLEVKEKQQETLQMLNSAHHHEAERMRQQDTAFHDESLQLSQEELYNLLQVLERGDEQELSRVLSSPTLKHALDQSIAQGELQDWFLEPWYPWWRPQLATSMVTDQEQENNSGDEDVEEVCIGKEATSHVETLDERLLRVPLFETLRPSSSSKQLPPQLKYNMLDLLYAVAWTLRLYHGVDNAKEVAIPAAHTVMKSSKVLSSRDACFESLEEVMTSSTAASSRAYQNGTECNTSWQVLAQDVALICLSRRQVGRALLEASDVLKAAVSVTKKSGDREGASEMRKLSKKIEFYLSWSQCQSELSLRALADDVEAWVAEWKPG